MLKQYIKKVSEYFTILRNMHTTLKTLCVKTQNTRQYFHINLYLSTDYTNRIYVYHLSAMLEFHSAEKYSF